jgi:small subunit ribosomal protein S8
VSDPVSNMLTSVRNAVATERSYVDVPLSRMKIEIASALVREGFIWSQAVVEEGRFPVVRLALKYGPRGEKVIQAIDRVSRPGRRVYVGCGDIPSVLQGLGTCILSTSKGILSGNEAKAAGVGGEVICKVW